MMSEGLTEQQKARKIRKSLRLLSSNINAGVLITSDYLVDQIAKANFGKEVAEIHEDTDQRKELDEALSDVLDYYFREAIGPLLAYAVCLTATIGSRYSLEEYEPPEEDNDGENPETTGKSEGRDGLADGQTRARKNDHPEGAPRKGNPKKGKPKK